MFNQTLQINPIHILNPQYTVLYIYTYKYTYRQEVKSQG